MNPIQKLLSKKVALYDSGYKTPDRITIPKKPLPKFKWRQSDLQAEAMKYIYEGKPNSGKNFGKGVGP